MPKSPSAKIQRRVFNLLKPQKAPPSAWDKIYSWIITRARVVIVLCEIVVVVCFVVKVGVDIRSKELDETITAKAFELDRFATGIEPTLRGIQAQSTTYEKVWERSTKYGEVLAEIHSYINNPAANLAITVANDIVTIQGDDVLSTLRQIEAQMKSSATFERVSLELNTEGQPGETGSGAYSIKAVIVEIATRPELTLDSANSN